LWDRGAKSPRLDNVEFVRHIDTREYAELKAGWDQAKMDIDALQADSQALRAGPNPVTSEEVTGGGFDGSVVRPR
jgi:hypothetical protein